MGGVIRIQWTEDEDKMTKMVWNQRELERLYQHYCDETRILDFEPRAIVEWAVKRGYEMPTPPTPQEMLVRLLSHAATAARRKDSKTSLLYRAALAYRKKVKGEERTFWFDPDGPTATFEKILASFHSRKEKALNILVSAAASVEHWLVSHPKDREQKELELGISNEEVRWRLLGPRSDENRDEKAG